MAQLTQRSKGFDLGDALVGAAPALLNIFARKELAEKKMAATAAQQAADKSSDIAFAGALSDVDNLLLQRAETATNLTNFQAQNIEFNRAVAAGEISKTDEHSIRALTEAQAAYENSREQAPLDAFKFEVILKNKITSIRSSNAGIEERYPEFLGEVRNLVGTQQSLLESQASMKREAKVRAEYGDNVSIPQRQAFAAREASTREEGFKLKEGNMTFDQASVSTRVISHNKSKEILTRAHGVYGQQQTFDKEQASSFLRELGQAEEMTIAMLNDIVKTSHQNGQTVDIDKLNKEIDRTRARFAKEREFITNNEFSKTLGEYSATLDLIDGMGLNKKADLMGTAIKAGGPGVAAMVRSTFQSGSGGQVQPKLRALAELEGLNTDTAEGLNGLVIDMVERITRPDQPVKGWTAFESYLGRNMVRSPAKVEEVVIVNALESMSQIAQTPEDASTNLREAATGSWSRKIQESSSATQAQFIHQKRGWDTQVANKIADDGGEVIYDSATDSLVVTTPMGNSVRFGGVEVPASQIKGGAALIPRRINQSLTKLINSSYRLSTGGKYIGILDDAETSRNFWITAFGKQDTEQGSE